MKSYYCDTATGQVFEAEAGERREGLMVRQGDEWVESLALPGVVRTEAPKAVPEEVALPTEPLPLPQPLPKQTEPRAEQGPMWFWEMIGWLAMIAGVIGGMAGESGLVAALGLGSGATMLMGCHAVQEICKAIREGHGKAKE